MDERQIEKLSNEHAEILSAPCSQGYSFPVIECGCKICSQEYHRAERIASKIRTLRLQSERGKAEKEARKERREIFDEEDEGYSLPSRWNP